MKNILFSLIASAALIFGSCSKGPNEPIFPAGFDDACTIDGGNFHNTDIEVKNVTSSSGTKNPNGSTYSECMVSGNTDTITSIQFDVRFNSVTTGTYNCDKATNTFVVITITTKSSGTPVQYNSVDGSSSVVVTEYGDVNGKIKGTFSGKFEANGQTYTVVKANFSVKRVS
jgi:hypothetical protein